MDPPLTFPRWISHYPGTKTAVRRGPKGKSKQSRCTCLATVADPILGCYATFHLQLVISQDTDPSPFSPFLGSGRVTPRRWGNPSPAKPGPKKTKSKIKKEFQKPFVTADINKRNSSWRPISPNFLVHHRTISKPSSSVSSRIHLPDQELPSEEPRT